MPGWPRGPPADSFAVCSPVYPQGDPTMNIADPIALLKMELQQTVVPQIIDLLSASIADGRPLHEVERGLCDLVLQVGRRFLGAFLDRHGTGDLGETITLTDDHEARGVEGLHTRRYLWSFVL